MLGNHQAAHHLHMRTQLERFGREGQWNLQPVDAAFDLFEPLQLGVTLALASDHRALDI